MPKKKINSIGNKELVNSEYCTIKLSDLKPFKRNPRKNDVAIKEVVKSIEKNGYLDPIEVDEDNVVLSGHTRLKSLLQKGITNIKVIRHIGLTKEQKDDYRIRANKTQEFAEWDNDILFEDYTKEQLADFGFDMEDFKNEIVEDNPPPIPEIPQTVLGDLYQLGKHRLLCGDSTIITDVEKLMGGAKQTWYLPTPLMV